MTKMALTPRSENKSSKQVENVSACLDCGKQITDEVRALQCDRCGNSWKCVECMNIPAQMYDAMVAGSGSELKWYCDSCSMDVHMGQSNSDNQLSKLTEIHDKIGKLLDKMLGFEQALGKKADIVQLESIEMRMAIVDSRIENIEKILHESKVREDEIEQKLKRTDRQFQDNQKLDERVVIDCIEKKLEQKNNDDAEERTEKEKRKTCLIIHGLQELDSEVTEDRISHDSDEVTNLMLEIGCETVQIQKLMRLGKPRLSVNDTEAITVSDKRPRPIKIVLKDEEQKNLILKNAKNLKKTQEGERKRIIIHQDLTLKEREARNKLWCQLKERQASGEQNLVIAKGKIVKKWW
jgi:predicted RNA-binding Zn-ribbon protein involved in translation (DUF1610 family)